VPSNPTPTGTFTSYTDFSRVTNRFDGPQLGVSCGWNPGRFALDLTGKLGTGVMHSEGRLQGETTQQMADGTSTHADGGVLVGAGGSGTISRDWFCVTPEVGLTIAYRITSWCRAEAGYDYLYVSRLARAPTLLGNSDSRQIPQLATFDPSVRGTLPGLGGQSFWAQGLHAGLEFRY
jgi:hypothetical protein